MIMAKLVKEKVDMSRQLRLTIKTIIKDFSNSNTFKTSYWLPFH